MELKVCSLSMQMKGENVKLHHDELEGLGYHIILDEKKKKYFGLRIRNATLEFQNKHNPNKICVLDGATIRKLHELKKRESDYWNIGSRR